MYKILIKIMVLAVGLVLFYARAGASSMNITPGSSAPDYTVTVLVDPSGSSPEYPTVHHLPSPILSSYDDMQSPGNTPLFSRSYENNPIATPALGELDGIAWDKLEQPVYVSVISRLLGLPADIGSLAPNPISANHTRLILSVPLISNRLSPSTGSSYPPVLNWKTSEGLGTSNYPHLSSTVSISHSTGVEGQADHTQDSNLSIINCAGCHMAKPVQIPRQIRGAD